MKVWIFRQQGWHSPQKALRTSQIKKIVQVNCTTYTTYHSVYYTYTVIYVKQFSLTLTDTHTDTHTRIHFAKLRHKSPRTPRPKLSTAF